MNQAPISKHWWVNEINRDGLRKKVDAVVVMGHYNPRENKHRAKLAAKLFFNYPFTHVIVTGTVAQMNEAQNQLFTHFVPTDKMIRVYAKTTFDQVQNAKHWGTEQFNLGNPVNRLVFIAHENELPHAQVAHDFTLDIPGCKCEFQPTGETATKGKLDASVAVNKTAVALFPFLYLTNTRQEQSFHSAQLAGLTHVKKEKTH